MAEHNRLRFDAVEKEVYLNKTKKVFSLLRLRKDFLFKNTCFITPNGDQKPNANLPIFVDFWVIKKKVNKI